MLKAAPTSIVGKVKNKKFAFFWLLIGGSIGNILMAFFILYNWRVLQIAFLPSAILSMLIAIEMADGAQRPKVWLGADLLLTAIILMLDLKLFALGTALPSILIIFGCILGIMDW